MKFIPLNNVDSIIIGHAINIDDRYFKKIDFTIGLFQSTAHETLDWWKDDKQKSAPAVLIPKEEFQWQKELFPKTVELENLFQNEVNLIVWFGKSVLKKEKYCSDHVVAHELKHIEQRFSDLHSVYKDRLLDFILYKRQPPTEIDAQNFADMTTAKQYNKTYNWINEANKLFEANLEKIKLINQAITANDKDVRVDSEFFVELNSDQNKRDLFKYFYSQI